MFQFKKLHLKDETSNFLKNNLKHSSKNIHNHKREKTFSNNINDEITTLNFNNIYKKEIYLTILLHHIEKLKQLINIHHLVLL